MLDFARSHPNECAAIIDILDRNGISNKAFSCSNWICSDASTKFFHQETDSSYTFITVPYWNKEEIAKKGVANFIFRWTSKVGDNDSNRYLSLQMDDGINILFSGFGCYHRQHRVDNKPFFNFASYQNRSFFHKLRMSIIRCIMTTRADGNN